MFITLFKINASCYGFVYNYYSLLPGPLPSSNNEMRERVVSLHWDESHCYSSSSAARNNPYERDSDDSAKIAVLEETLASKLAEFLDSSFPYKLHLIPSTMKNSLYKGPSAGLLIVTVKTVVPFP